MRSLYLSLFALAVTLCLAETTSAQLTPDAQRGPLRAYWHSAPNANRSCVQLLHEG
jgi:hypothetical protein